MSRRRYISTTISLDRVVNELAMGCGDFAALFYTWMIPHAEDSARMTGDPYELRCMVIPGRNDKSDADVANALVALHGAELVAWDSEAGIVYFDSESFYRYQSYVSEKNRADNSDHFRRLHGKTKASAKQRTSAENTGERRETAENAASLSPSPSPSPSKSAREPLPVENDGCRRPPSEVSEEEQEDTPPAPSLKHCCGTCGNVDRCNLRQSDRGGIGCRNAEGGDHWKAPAAAKEEEQDTPSTPSPSKPRSAKRFALPDACDGATDCSVRRCHGIRQSFAKIDQATAGSVYNPDTDLGKQTLHLAGYICAQSQDKLPTLDAQQRQKACQRMFAAAGQRVAAAHSRKPIANLPAYIVGMLKRNDLTEVIGDELLIELRRDASAAYGGSRAAALAGSAT